MYIYTPVHYCHEIFENYYASCSFGLAQDIYKYDCIRIGIFLSFVEFISVLSSCVEKYEKWPL